VECGQVWERLTAGDSDGEVDAVRAVICLMLLAATECPSQEPPNETRASTRPPAPEVIEGEESDLMLPGFEPVGPDGSPAFSVTPILDEETGRPILGAEVRVVREPCCAINDRWTTARSAKSDERGWVRLPVTGDPGWVFVLAEGYAPRAEFATVLDNQPFLMRRGLDVPVEVRDWWDRPISGVAIEQLLGCGHTPNVRRALTDRAGLALVPRVDPGRDGDLWPVKDGYASAYGSIFGWTAAMPPVLIRMGPAPTIDGTVVDAADQPVRNVFVGSPQCHRGPWSITDRAGHFRLIGATSLSLEVREEFGDRLLASFENVRGPASGIVIKLGDAQHEATITGQRPESGVEAIVRLKFHPQDLPQGAKVIVVSGDTQVDVTDEMSHGGSYAAPLSSPIAVKVIVGEDEKVIPVDTSSPKHELNLAVDWYKSHSLKIRLLGPDGQGVVGRVHVRSARNVAPHSRDEPGAVAIGMDATNVLFRTAGRVFVYAWPDDSSLVPARTSVDVSAQEQPDLRIRFETAASKRLVINGSDGAPVGGQSVVLMREGLVWESMTQEDGSIAIPWSPIRTGTTVLAKAAGESMPCRWVLEGPGPWTLRFPVASLDVEARQTDGSAVAGFGVLVDSYPFDSADGHAVVHALAPGQHEVWVGARGFRPKRVSLSVTAGQERRVAVVLRPKER
jgi:hypothetical protein